MSKQMPKLCPQDASVVDLVLNHASPGGGVTRVAATISEARLSATTKLLSLLDHLTDDEPPADLASRTMQFIARAESRQVGHRVSIGESPSSRIH